MNELQEKKIKKHNNEIEEILKNKKVILILSRCTEAIERNVKDIVKKEKQKCRNDDVQTETIHTGNEVEEERDMFKQRKYRYYDKGF